MEAPLHKLCGTRHWSTQACPAMKSEGRQLSASTPAAKGIDRRDSARSVRPTSEGRGSVKRQEPATGTTSKASPATKPIVGRPKDGPATKSTAARKDVRQGRGEGRSGAKGQIVEASVAVAQMVETPVQPDVAGSSPASAAGTQAPLVDTKPRSSKGRIPGLEQALSQPPSDAGDAGSNPAMGTKPKRGRPRLANPKSKRADYQRELMRKRYAAKKQPQP